jgi:hypothetical protein
MNKKENMQNNLAFLFEHLLGVTLHAHICEGRRHIQEDARFNCTRVALEAGMPKAMAIQKGPPSCAEEHFGQECFI